MALQEEFEAQGNFLFKYRGILPIIILVFGMLLYAYKQYVSVDFIEMATYYELICLVVTFIGLVVRIYTVGHTPKNTSGRNTESQVADELNTSGIYSIVRHPLYLGNFFMWLGLAMLTHDIWFVTTFVFVYWVYYERIMYAEEQFLRRKFGEVYTDWASQTPAFIPAVSNFRKSVLNFSWKKVIKKEKNGITAVFTVFYLFELIGRVVKGDNIIDLNSVWLYAFVISFVIYIILKILKNNTSVFDETGR
ncbi:MAG: DUF1295 domain-containing protein [Bacteroidales bacterium]|nr:DUF1295 domain-containing protein [Bacteroidales bacterium]